MCQQATSNMQIAPMENRRLRRPLLCFSDEPYSKYRLFRLVQKLNLPFCILLQFASGAADEIATNLGHFCPSSTSVCKLALNGSAGVIAILGSKGKCWHGRATRFGRSRATHRISIASFLARYRRRYSICEHFRTLRGRFLGQAALN